MKDLTPIFIDLKAIQTNVGFGLRWVEIGHI